jgi:hypothetical protein
MSNTKKSTSRALRTSVPRKTAEPNAPAAPATAYVSDYAIGDQVSHPMFGNGTITGIDENKLTIEFSESVTKQIIDGYVKHRRERSAQASLPLHPIIPKC